MPFELIRQDITKMETDAIVNAANPQLQEGGGVCGAIFQAAGAEELQAACDAIGPIQIGEAVSTDGFRLPAKMIIHTAGPVWHGGDRGEEQLLRASYLNALLLAETLGCGSIAFPLLSAGAFGYPKGQALRVAISAIEHFLEQHEMSVYLIVFDKAAFKLSSGLFHNVSVFIDEHYVEEQEALFTRGRYMQEDILFEQKSEAIPLDRLLEELDESFSVRLLRLIDERGLKDPDVYKKANIDRKLFSKIRNSSDYTPMKRTAIAFAIALELDLDETEDLLETAGYTLSRSSKSDLIIHYFIQSGIYNMFEINEVLFLYDQPLLGG
ncbi:macro domain-containing protein [Indiicoccus explosivorum]|uniref:macro domain-containing protein n=1 Tax=Indiicoccus explosivorum TaxID=1917864 RepID=UPI000B44FAEA|nr:macro domain-containing protein [Indiicoccus explosivorum]